MQDESSFIGEGRVAVRIPVQSFAAKTGDSVRIPLLLRNLGSTEDFFELSVRGIPMDWVSLPAPVTWLDPGDEREVEVLVIVPPMPQAHPGTYPLVIRVTSQEEREHTISLSCTLTVEAGRDSSAEPVRPAGPPAAVSPDALGVAPRLGVHLTSSEYSVAPGGTVIVPVILANNGPSDDVVTLSLEGIPTAWVSTPSPQVPLSAGQQRQVSLSIQPPRSSRSRAGRHAVTVRIESQSIAGQTAEADWVLTVAVFAEFLARLVPEWLAAGDPAQVTVENLGNIQDTFTLTCQSFNDELAFEPGPTQSIRIAPGQVATAQFRASLRQRPLIGGEKSYPLTAVVQSSTRETQTLRGEVGGRGLIPAWLLAAVLLFVLACACAVLALALTEGGLIQGAAPGAPAPAVTIDVEEPELSPTLPAESPTETEVVPQPTPTSGGEGIEVPPGQSPEEPVEIQTQPPQGGSGE